MKTKNSINLNRPNAPRLFFLLSVFVLAGLLPMLLPQTSSNARQENFAGTATNFSSAALQGDEAILHLKQSGAYDSLAAAFEAARYRIKPSETGAVASNEANDLRMNFTESGWQIKSTAKDKNWRSAWRLSSFGYGERQTAAADGKLQTDGNRIEIWRESQQLTEWFENTARGVEHGFTLAARPAEGNNGEALRLVMTLGGDLTARADADGQGLTLAETDGTKALRYEKLQVWDAQGKELMARLRAENGEVWLEVDDSAAAYPITIDPTFVQQQKLSASDGAEGDVFGFSVAIAGNTAVVGAFLDNIDTNANQGSAYVFVRNGTTWTEQQKLTATDGTAGDEFGWSVAIAGETIIVGAHFDDNGTNTDQGSAYVFVRNGTTWTQQQKLTASEGAAGDEFGYSVAIAGETAVVGSLLDNIFTNGDQGSAYVFVRNGTTWTEQQKLTAVDGAANDGFGYSVAIAGDTAVVGSLGDDLSTNIDQGSTYVFVRNGTTWTEQQKLTAADGAAGDEFGWSVAIAGETIIVGALGDDLSTNTDQGSAYIFARSNGTTWTQQQKLTASDGAAGDEFGWSVSIAGDTVIVGALSDDIGTNIDQGSAYVFVRNGTTWTEQQRLTAADGAANDGFGYSVAIAGETIIVGAPVDSIGTNADQGSAYIFITDATPTTGFEADVASRPNGDGSILSDDVVQIRRFLNGTHTPDQTTSEFQRADSSPFDTKGDGRIFSDDVVQTRRYQNGVNPKQPAAGPTTQSAARTDDVIDKFTAGLSNTIIENALNGVQREVRVENAMGSAGQQVTINIRVDAQGDESEYGFILNYQSRVLSNPVVGAGSAGASVRSCNVSDAGQLKCSVGAFTNNNPSSSDSGIGEIAAGTNQILITVTFTVEAGISQGDTHLTLSQVNASSDAPQLFMPTVTNGVVTILAPTAASAQVGGRVMQANGRGVANARVKLTDQNGNMRTARTNPFGYYQFTGVEVGQTYVIAGEHKQYKFDPQVITVNGSLSEVNLIASETLPKLNRRFVQRSTVGN
jgi:hypothetical protein